MENERNVECEVRSFIDEEQHRSLIDRFMGCAEFLGEDEQETRYFDCPQDLRIQKNRAYAKVWLKKGNMHDEGREEIEIRVARDDFGRLEALFGALGYRTQIVWYRRRHSFRWDDVEVAIDHTRGYGRIIELEIKCAAGSEEPAIKKLHEKLEELGVRPTPRAAFDERFRYYKEHWKDLVENERTPA